MLVVGNVDRRRGEKRRWYLTAYRTPPHTTHDIDAHIAYIATYMYMYSSLIACYSSHIASLVSYITRHPAGGGVNVNELYTIGIPTAYHDGRGREPGTAFSGFRLLVFYI